MTRNESFWVHDIRYTPVKNPPGCHGLGPWVGLVRSYVAPNVKLHGASPWHL